MSGARKVKFVGPITLEAKVHFTDGESLGCATVGLAPAHPVTVETLYWAIGQTLKALPEGYVLLDAENFFNQVLVREKTGQAGNFAVPAPCDYDLDKVMDAAEAALASDGDEEEA